MTYTPPGTHRSTAIYIRHQKECTTPATPRTGDCPGWNIRHRTHNVAFQSPDWRRLEPWRTCWLARNFRSDLEWRSRWAGWRSKFRGQRPESTGKSISVIRGSSCQWPKHLVLLRWLEKNYVLKSQFGAINNKVTNKSTSSMAGFN